MKSQNEEFLEFVTDQLAGLRALSSRPMFGCIGLYSGDDFFAIIDEGRLYFVTDEQTRAGFVAARMQTFHALKSYYEVPVDVLEDDVELGKWAHAAVAAQRRRGRPRRSTARARPPRRRRVR
jgi:DNA transformation protein and related proteins